VPRQNSQIDADLQNHKDDGSAGPGVRRLLAGDVAAGVATHREDSPVPTKMPHVDTQQGNAIFGASIYPKEFPTDPGPFDEPGLTADVFHTAAGQHDRAGYFRNYANPAGPTTTIRTWGSQGSAEVFHGNAADYNCGHPGDLTGAEGAAIHWGSGILQSVVSLLASMTNRGGGTMVEAIGSLILFPLNAFPSAGTITKAIGLYIKHRTEGYAEPVTKYGLLIDDLCGACGIGFLAPLAKLAVNGGLNVGASSDPGAGCIEAAADIQAKGTFKSADGSSGVSGSFVVGAQTFTIKNGIITSIV
jgi:hypothetical protein